MRHPYSGLGPRKGAPWVGGGLVAIPPHDPPEIADQPLGINGPFFWTLIEDKDDLFLVPFATRYRGGEKCHKMRHPNSRLGPEWGYPGLVVNWSKFPHGSRVQKEGPLIPNGRSAIPGGPWGNGEQFSTNRGGPLSGA